MNTYLLELKKKVFSGEIDSKEYKDSRKFGNDYETIYSLFFAYKFLEKDIFVRMLMVSISITIYLFLLLFYYFILVESFHLIQELR